MTVDGSYTAWVRPTRRVHLALSAGMILTGVILIAAGAFGGGSPVRSAPVIGRTADSVIGGSPGGVIGGVGVIRGLGGVAGTGGVIGGTDGVNAAPGALLPVAPLMHFASPVTRQPKPGVKPGAKPGAKPHAKPKPHPRHTPHPSDVSHPQPRPTPHRAAPPAAPTPPAAPAPQPSRPSTH